MSFFCLWRQFEISQSASKDKGVYIGIHLLNNYSSQPKNKTGYYIIPQAKS